MSDRPTEQPDDERWWYVEPWYFEPYDPADEAPEGDLGHTCDGNDG